MMVIGYDGEIKSRIVIDRYMSDEPEKKTRAEEAVEMAEMLLSRNIKITFRSRLKTNQG